MRPPLLTRLCPWVSMLTSPVEPASPATLAALISPPRLSRLWLATTVCALLTSLPPVLSSLAAVTLSVPPDCKVPLAFERS